jgi:hypothetical protein
MEDIQPIGSGFTVNLDKKTAKDDKSSSRIPDSAKAAKGFIKVHFPAEKQYSLSAGKNVIHLNG